MKETGWWKPHLWWEISPSLPSSRSHTYSERHKLARCSSSSVTHNCFTATSASLEWTDRQSNYGAAFPNSVSSRQETSHCEKMRHHQSFNIFNTFDVNSVIFTLYFHLISFKGHFQTKNWMKWEKKSFSPDLVTSHPFFRQQRSYLTGEVQKAFKTNQVNTRNIDLQAYEGIFYSLLKASPGHRLIFMA